MNPNVPLSEQIGVAGVIDPQSAAVGSVSTGWVSLDDLPMVLAVVHAGTLGAGGTVDAKLEQATDGAGTGVKDVTNKAITQIAVNNQIALIHCYDFELDVANDFTHVRLTVTVGTAASEVSAIIMGANSRFGPASDYNSAEVVETVVGP